MDESCLGANLRLDIGPSKSGLPSDIEYLAIEGQARPIHIGLRMEKSVESS